MPYPNYK